MSTMTASEVRYIAARLGFSHAEFCVEQAESQGDATEARAELNRISNGECDAEAAAARRGSYPEAAASPAAMAAELRAYAADLGGEG